MDRFLPPYYIILIMMWSVITSNYFLKALLEDKQTQEDIEKMNVPVSQIVQDAAVRTKKVVRSFNYI